MNKSNKAHPWHNSISSMSGVVFKYSKDSERDVKKGYYLKRLDTLKELKVNEKNKEIVIDFLNQKESEGLKSNRMLRLISTLQQILFLTDKRFDNLTLKDVENIILSIRRKDYTEWTKSTNIAILKIFVKWLNKNFDLKINTDEIKVNTPKQTILPESLITEGEFSKLINATDDFQTRVILNLLFESGCRIGEVLSLKIQNVSFNEYGCRIRVSGKTGERIIPLVWVSNSLRQFIESHPNKDNQESNLWYFERKKKILPLNYDILRMRLLRLCRKVGLNKRIYFHLFRHTRMSSLAKDLPDNVLKSYAGWTADSDMAKTYVHLSMRDIEDNLLSKVYGIKTNGNNGEKLKVCSKCGETNPYFNKICSRCKTDLDERKLQEKLMTEEQMKQVNDFSQVFMEFLKIMEKKDPTIWDSMKEVMKKKGINI